MTALHIPTRRVLTKLLNAAERDGLLWPPRWFPFPPNDPAKLRRFRFDYVTSMHRVAGKLHRAMAPLLGTCTLCKAAPRPGKRYCALHARQRCAVKMRASRKRGTQPRWPCKLCRQFGHNRATCTAVAS